MIAAILTRKSNDEADKTVKSVEVQESVCTRFIESQGWTRGSVFADDGVSGAVYDRPGLIALLAAAEIVPRPFDVVVVSALDRIGRGETIETLTVLDKLERAGGRVFSADDGQELTSADDEHGMKEMMRTFKIVTARVERSKTVKRVRDAGRERFERGFVVGGRVFGYRNERLPGVKANARLTIDPEQAAVVRRIFERAAEGLGFVRIAKTLNAACVPGPDYACPSLKDTPGHQHSDACPRRPWAASGIREVLKRDLYRGVIVYGRIQRGMRKGKKTRTKIDPSQWLQREAPELRIVSEDLWKAAHAKMAENASQFLRLHGKIVGQRESHAGKFHHLLSGFLACGICGGSLVATTRGRKNLQAYICTTRRFAGTCENTTAVPMDRLHDTVIASLQDTFSPENFERFQRERAADEQARVKREAERQSIIAALPKLAADEQRIVKRIATVEDDSLVAALKEQWSAAKAERERAEARLAEIEGEERDLREQAEAVETFRQRWQDWRGALTSEPVLARQLLRKILVGPILVLPKGRGCWEFIGGSRYDAVLHGALSPRADAIRAWSPEARARMIAALRGQFPAAGALGPDAWTPAPIAGGSDGGYDGHDPSGPPCPNDWGREAGAAGFQPGAAAVLPQPGMSSAVAEAEGAADWPAATCSPGPRRPAASPAPRGSGDPWRTCIACSWRRSAAAPFGTTRSRCSPLLPSRPATRPPRRPPRPCPGCRPRPRSRRLPRHPAGCRSPRRRPCCSSTPRSWSSRSVARPTGDTWRHRTGIGRNSSRCREAPSHWDRWGR